MKTATALIGNRVEVKVRELNMNDIAASVDLFNDIKQDLGGGFDIFTAITKYKAVREAINSVIVFSENEDDVKSCGMLSISELGELLPLFKEVNSYFLELLAKEGLSIEALTKEWEKAKT